jgi:hypothetical protein
MTARPRLTPHQRRTFDRLVHLTRWQSTGWVPAESVGSRGALDHLVRKGWAERTVQSVGPRGGERYAYRPVGEVEP